MIGNDIVDLAAARRQSNWQRPGFLQKVFTVEEQKLIVNYSNPEMMVWILWSMKEAAYKIYNRETGVRAYIPHLLHCNLDIYSLSGKVLVKGKIYYTATKIEKTFIDTIAVACPDHFNTIALTDTKNVFKDDVGLPYVMSPSSGKVPASVSNHGRYLRAVYIDLSAPKS